METKSKKTIFVTKVALPDNLSNDDDSFFYEKKLNEFMENEVNLRKLADKANPPRNLHQIKNSQVNQKSDDKSLLFSTGYTTLSNLDKTNVYETLEKLEAEFFNSKSQLLKISREVESLKEKIFQEYVKLYPHISVEEIQEKFKY